MTAGRPTALPAPPAAPAPRIGMWDIERAHPWRWAALYAGAIVLVLLLSHAGARGWL